MISKEVQEKLREKYNPDGSQLRLHQLRMLEMLKYIDEICKQNQIRYWLSSGTCLGAVRHGGFIPWDDDTDIEMYREDFLKFEKAFVETDDFVLQTWKNDQFYNLPFAKMRDKKTMIYNSLYTYKGVFIDVFIIERVPKSLSLFALKFTGMMQNMYTNARDINTWYYKNRYLLGKKIYFNLIIPFIRVLSYIARIFTQIEFRHTIGCNWTNNIRKKDEIGMTIPFKFEGLSLPIPKNYDSYLKRIYGNYMTLPDKEEIQLPHAEFLKFK